MRTACMALVLLWTRNSEPARFGGKLDIDLVPQTRVVTHTRTLHALAGVMLHFSLE